MWASVEMRVNFRPPLTLMRAVRRPNTLSRPRSGRGVGGAARAMQGDVVWLGPRILARTGAWAEAGAGARSNDIPRVVRWLLGLAAVCGDAGGLIACSSIGTGGPSQPPALTATKHLRRYCWPCEEGYSAEPTTIRLQQCHRLSTAGRTVSAHCTRSMSKAVSVDRLVYTIALSCRRPRDAPPAPLLHTRSPESV